MIRANFFDIFFKYKQNSSKAITKYNSYKKIDLEERIITEIMNIEQRISANSKDLIEAQIVKFRSTFSNSDNLIEKIGRNVYKSKLEDSIHWHQAQLKELYIKRKELQIKLEKIKGIFWISRIKRFLRILIIIFFLLFSLFIFLSGFMIIIYLLPLILFIFLGYLLVKKIFNYN